MISSKGQYALDRATLHRAAPSIFADRPYEKTSDRYNFMPTVDVLDTLAKEGFLPVSVNESKTRIDAKRGYLKHSIRLRHRRDIGTQAKSVGDVFPEVIVTNSHDGSSTFVFEGGLFRLACSNGMCLPLDGAHEQIRIRHSGNVDDNVIDGCITVLDGAVRFGQEMQEWRGIQLDKSEQLLLADHAAALRWDRGDDGKALAPIQPSKLLTARRPDDTPNDLYHVANRIQENLVKGGLRGVGSTGRRMSTRAVTSVDADLKLNRQLMTLAAEFAKLKRGG